MADWIPNKGWESGDAGGWTLTQSAGFVNAVQTTHPRTGTYSLIMFRFMTGARWGKAEYSSPDYVAARGKEAIFTVYRKFYASAVRYPQTKYIRIDDGVSAPTDFNLTEALGSWALQTVTHAVNAAATKLDFIIYVWGLDTAHHRLSIDDMNATVDGEEEVPASVVVSPTPVSAVAGILAPSVAIADVPPSSVGGLNPALAELML